MDIKIRTKTPVNYDSVNTQKIAKVVVELIEWREQKDGAYYATVSYYAELDNGNPLSLKNHQIYLSEDKFNMLHNAVDNQIPSELTPYQKRQLRKKLALYLYVVNDFIDEEGTKLIYGTAQNDWETVD